MQSHSINVDNLRNLIGQEVDYDGRRCKIIEILEDIPALILQHHDPSTTIQADQHGEAHRKVPGTITLPVVDRESGGLHPAFSDLNVSHLL
ncbi:hypothetical protein Tel_09675 [Candidatus Tenderia electrophaga]|jgi:hypothetical protein|uniref:Uncharacterized protein n=1 Tax=Candidatus Tenderia electrophaga TaxID=1748243 RepID=A0A0S2TE05_9GAMM|nr:hypothetical protein Tel_09675 [Candidatus Tenderia electrophaga]